MAPKKRTPKINVGEYPYADIMPISRKDAIDRAIAKAKWTKIVSYGVIVAIVISAGSFGFKFFEQLNYDGAVRDQSAIETEIATHADVDGALTIRDTITGNILRASAATINWQDLMNRVSSNLPDNSKLTSFEVKTGGVDKEKPAIAVLVNISSEQPIAYSAVLDSFSNINGLVDGSLQIGDLFAQGSAEDGDLRYIYPVAFSIDGSILANLFAYLTGDAEAPETPEKIEEEQIGTPTPDPEDTSIIDDAEDAVDETNADTADGAGN